MANVTINSTNYSDVRFVRLPKQSDNTKMAVYQYMGEGSVNHLLPIKQGDITIDGSTLTAYDYNKFKVEAPVRDTIYNITDYSRNTVLFNQNSSRVNVRGMGTVLSLKSGDTIRMVATSNTENDINASGNQISINAAKIYNGYDVNLFASENVTRDSEAHTITCEKTLAEDFDVCAVFIYIFAGTTTEPDIALSIYLNGDQIL